MAVKLYTAPELKPLLPDLRVLSWTILNEDEGIKGSTGRIEFNIEVQVHISDGSMRTYSRWEGVMTRWLPPNKRYEKEKDIKTIRQWLSPRLIKNGLHRGRKAPK